MTVTKPGILESFQEVLRTLPLKQRRRLGTHLGVLAEHLGVEFKQVSNLFQDQRELKEGGYEYHIQGSGGTKYFPMSLRDAAVVLGLEPEYLRTRLVAYAKKYPDRAPTYSPRHTYPTDTGGDPEYMWVTRTKKKAPPPEAVPPVRSDERSQQTAKASGVTL